MTYIENLLKKSSNQQQKTFFYTNNCRMEECSKKWAKYDNIFIKEQRFWISVSGNRGFFTAYMMFGTKYSLKLKKTDLAWSAFETIRIRHNSEYIVYIPCLRSIVSRIILIWRKIHWIDEDDGPPFTTFNSLWILEKI